MGAPQGRTRATTIAILVLSLLLMVSLAYHFGYRGAATELRDRKQTPRPQLLPAGAQPRPAAPSLSTRDASTGSTAAPTSTAPNKPAHIAIYSAPGDPRPHKLLTSDATIEVLEVDGGWRRVRVTTPDAPATSGWVTWSAIMAAAGSASSYTDHREGHVITGVVHFTGAAPEMPVPEKRMDYDVCRDKSLVHEAVVVQDGRLADVFVGLVGDAARLVPDGMPQVVLDQRDCVYHPRMLGVMVEQVLLITNSDATMHNVQAKAGADLKFNFAQPKGAPPQEKSFDEPGIVRFQCDVHPWMRAFAYVADNPHFSVTQTTGFYQIEDVPAGEYTLFTWHPRYGRKERRITVGSTAQEVNFTYDGTEPAPQENIGEFTGL